MFYHIETEERTSGGKTGTVYTLKHTGHADAEIWPAHGFNCLRWRVATGNGWRNLLYAAPDWDNNPVHTRSGIPILFPFPNRIRGGKFRHGGRAYQLPINDPAKKNAIHGFAPRLPWRVFGYSVEERSAWIHADFEPRVDAPETADLWPSDYRLSAIYRLVPGALRLELTVRNLGDEALPFGIGLHPYLRFPCADETIDRCRLFAPARSLWKLDECLPFGEKELVPDPLNFNSSRQLAGMQLDNLYTDLGAIAEESDGMLLRTEIGHADLPGAVQVWTTRDFGESVLFIPPHRQAVCVEPYTCATDAINLQERGIDAGWKSLPPGGIWTGAVMFRWNPEVDV
jgi:aldose 1-epimerase